MNFGPVNNAIKTLWSFQFMLINSGWEINVSSPSTVAVESKIVAPISFFAGPTAGVGNHFDMK